MTAGTYITVVNMVDVHRSGLCEPLQGSHANQKGVTHALVIELILSGVVILHEDTYHYLHALTHAGW